LDDLNDTDKTAASGDDSLDGSVTRADIGAGPADFQPGFVFAGRYEILSEGQRGGMGVVYKCRDTKLKRLSALKLIHPHLQKSSQAIERFRQEVAISLDLQHAHIVRVYDLGESEGREFFTMEWIGGKSLRELILERKQQKRPFSIDEAYRIISQLCEALQYAHRYTIHRDIKPENILLTVDRDELEIKLTDFGIAKMLTTSQFTATSLQMGTPYYMAPEQKLDAGNVDQRADIYSVGVVLFELLTLENTVGPELPTDLNPELPKEIDDVFRKAVALRPERRYGDASEISAALLQVVQTQWGRRERALKLEEAQKKEEAQRAEREAEIARRQREEEAAKRKAEQERAEREAEAARQAAEEERTRQEQARQKRLEEERRKRGEEESRLKVAEEQRWLEEAARQSNERRKRRNVWIGIGLFLLVLAVMVFGYGIRPPDERRPAEPPSAAAPAPAVPVSKKTADKEPLKDQVKHKAGGEVFTSPTLGAKFVLIPAGTFLMGSPSHEEGRGNGETQHQVTISRPFYLQTTEVTQGQWRRVMESNPSYFSNCGDDCPVEQVSWNDVQDFISKLNSMEGTDKYRLPPEAQWEYSARAGTQTRFHWGNQDDCSKANYGNSPWSSGCKGINPGKTIRGGSFTPNAWGLYNMHGNVYEWVQDWYSDYPSVSVTDPTGPSSGSYRVFRGGSWGDIARRCRAADRYVGEPGVRGSCVGVRLLRTY
jgi:formylglycine-generating enzyme required for sulfatase activity/tRNA A-37 threonylcarbamoyl transferase component Bud32